FIVIDYTDEAPGAQEEIKAKLSAMSGDIRDILRLFEINRKVMNREKRVSTLYDIYGKLNMLEGRESLMKSFFREVRAFDISGGYLAEYIPGERAFEVSESFNYPENIRGRKFSVKEDEIVRSVYEKSGAAVVDSAAPSGISLNFRRSDIGSFFISVLRDKGSVYGFVKLDKEKGGGFGGFEVRTLEMIMSRITILLENAALYDKIKKQATTDGLTGLCNHLTFQEKLAVMIERQGKEGGQGVSLCLIDIDYFKKFNDTFGHQEGDRVLQKTALMLKSFEKKHEGSLAARYGGEEFVFVMQGANLRAAAAAAEEIRAYAGKNISGGNGKEQRRITLSIGVASLPETAKSQRELIKNADEMLYAAKEQGRDRVVWREG
ncbi:MAG TPA: GGDEF domain-containing protein, partial [bacterium]|nr:GGDEF domain-containing protein [bacterium]